jgi:hypothetical protein
MHLHLFLAFRTDLQMMRRPGTALAGSSRGNLFIIQMD